MTKPSPMNRRFVDTRGKIITGRDAIQKYPDPQFYMRAGPSMTLSECREALQIECNEAARVVEMLRGTASFDRKAPIINMANKLHDFRVSIDLHGGNAGQPFLWEE